MSEILPYRDGYSHRGVRELLRIYYRLGGIHEFCQEFLIIMDDGMSIGARKSQFPGPHPLLHTRPQIESRRFRDEEIAQSIYQCRENLRSR